MRLKIRRANPNESEILTALAHAAKRHWRYPENWIEAWKAELTITQDFIADNEVFVAIVEGEIAGCCALVVNTIAELEHMWIDPQLMGNGVGRALFEHATRRAQALGFRSLELSADPNAEGFYQHMGALKIGDMPAEVLGHSRLLPRMKVELNR